MLLDLTGVYLATVKDVIIENNLRATSNGNEYIKNTLKMSENDIYFDAGFLVFNIKAWLNNNLVEKCLKFLANEPQLKCLDQDVLNYVCKGKVNYLSQSWNDIDRWHDKMPLKEDINKRNIHYLGSIKPWHAKSVRYGDVWWEYAKKNK